MIMEQSCALSQEQRLEQILGLALAGGASDSIFPKVEHRIQTFSTIQRGLGAVREPAEGEFRSFMDLLLCSTFPEITALCARFYKQGGLPLRDQITHAGRDTLEILLLGALEVACIHHQHYLPVTWAEVRRFLWINLDLPAVHLFPNGIPTTPLHLLAAEAG